MDPLITLPTSETLPLLPLVADVANALLALLCVAATLASLIAPFALFAWLRRTPTEAPRATATAPGPSVWVTRLGAIRDGATRTGDLRRGCHDLSRLHEDWLEPQLRRTLDGHTADEIVAAWDQQEARLATTLRDLAYGARAPTPSQFGEACERLEAAFKRPPKARR